MKNIWLNKANNESMSIYQEEEEEEKLSINVLPASCHKRLWESGHCCC